MLYTRISGKYRCHFSFFFPLISLQFTNTIDLIDKFNALGSLHEYFTACWTHWKSATGSCTWMMHRKQWKPYRKRCATVHWVMWKSTAFPYWIGRRRRASSRHSFTRCCRRWMRCVGSAAAWPAKKTNKLRQSETLYSIYVAMKSISGKWNVAIFNLVHSFISRPWIIYWLLRKMLVKSARVRVLF